MPKVSESAGATRSVFRDGDERCGESQIAVLGSPRSLVYHVLVYPQTYLEKFG